VNAIETMNSRVPEPCEPEPRNIGNGAICGAQSLRAGIRFLGCHMRARCAHVSKRTAGAQPKEGVLPCGLRASRIWDQNGLSQPAPRHTADFRFVISNWLLFISPLRRGQERDQQPTRALGAAPSLLLMFLLSVISVFGCGGQKSTVDPAPFLQAVTSYLQQNNMVLKVKRIKSGPTVTQDEAVMTASLTHAELGGPAVTWKLTFRRQSDGTWEVAKHEVR